jgi:hypothetical protein
MAVTLKSKFYGSCPKHSRYNPALQGEGAIKGGCPVCSALHQVIRRHEEFERAIRSYEFVRSDLESLLKRALVDTRTVVMTYSEWRRQ